MDHLIVVLTKGFQVSTKCDTITYYDSPKVSTDHNGSKLKIVAQTIEKMISLKEIRPFKVQLRNIRPENIDNLSAFKKLLERVQSIKLRFSVSKQSGPEQVSTIQDFLPLASNLEELSLIVDCKWLLASMIVRQITNSISSKMLRSLTLTGLSTSNYKLQRILQPFKTSIKMIALKNSVFTDNSFVDFISHIQDNFSLDYVSFKNICDHKHLDRVTLYGKDINKGLRTLKTELLEK